MVAGDGGMICMCWDLIRRGSLSSDAREVSFGSSYSILILVDMKVWVKKVVHIDQVHVNVRDVGHYLTKKCTSILEYVTA